jgi:hypothetical protein
MLLTRGVKSFKGFYAGRLFLSIEEKQILVLNLTFGVKGSPCDSL